MAIVPLPYPTLPPVPAYDDVSFFEALPYPEP